jgi:small-conductance mechanosensitive channel
MGWLASTLHLHVSAAQAGAFVRAAIYVVVGIALARLAAVTVNRATRHMGAQERVLLRRLASYSVLTLFLASALREAGFRFDVLLGAAGILTVAVGFASQTSASNMISGLFLMLERSIAIGDIINVGGTVGEVLSVDLLSTRLRTFDNLMVRIPNQTMVTTQITNYNRLPIRRFDLQVGVAYKEDLAKVEKALLDIADRNPLCLENPAPLLISMGFGASSINYQLSVWAKRENWLELRNRITREVKAGFDQLGIELPFPHVELYTGPVTEPFPVRLVNPAVAPGASSGGPSGGTTSASAGSGEGPADRAARTSTDPAADK